MNQIQPIATCKAHDCRGCDLAGKVHCHFRLSDLAHFMSISLPSFFLGLWGMLRYNQEMILPYALFCGIFFGLVEIRVLCSHCPHYAQPGALLRCWANHGIPKLWKYRPGPLSRIERGMLLGGFGLIWGFPFVVLTIAGDWLLLLGFSLASVVFFTLLKRNFCSRCMNFFCPLNGVTKVVRARFWELNPGASSSSTLDLSSS